MPGPKPRSVAERFERHLARAGKRECWEWTGARDVKGYGFMRGPAGGPRWVKAHRVAWEIHHGRAVPEGLLVCHTCDNPPCCNPAHLFIGTHADNNADRDRKGRLDRRDGEHNNRARLSDHEVAAIRAAVLDGATQQSLADRFGVSQAHVSRLVRRQQRR